MWLAIQPKFASVNSCKLSNKCLICISHFSQMPAIASGLHQVIPVAIDQRPPGGIDDVAGYSHGGPLTGAVRAIDEDTGAGGGAAVAIDATATEMEFDGGETVFVVRGDIGHLVDCTWMAPAWMAAGSGRLPR